MAVNRAEVVGVVESLQAHREPDGATLFYVVPDAEGAGLPPIVPCLATGSRQRMIERFARPGRRLAIWGVLAMLHGGRVGIEVRWIEFCGRMEA